jgi:hypothetical protein
VNNKKAKVKEREEKKKKKVEAKKKEKGQIETDSRKKIRKQMKERAAKAKIRQSFAVRYCLCWIVWCCNNRSWAWLFNYGFDYACLR